MSNIEAAMKGDMEKLDALPAANPMDAVMQYAMSGNAVDMDVMRGLMDMRKEMAAEQARVAYNAAMSRAQANMPLIKKDARGQSGNYGSRQEIIKRIRPVYTAEGLAISFDQEPSPTQGLVRHLCIVRHELGHSEVHHMDLPPDDSGNKNNVQAHGSASVYAIRYLLAEVFLLGFDDDPDDDDGEKAAKKGPSTESLLERIALYREHFDFVAKIKSAADVEDEEERTTALAHALEEQAQIDRMRNLESEATLRSIWGAPSKGGILESEEMKLIKSTQVVEARKHV